MLYIVFTTGCCNLKCSYCGGSFPKHLVPWEVKYRVERLVDFLSQDSSPVVAFYGGEPLLNWQFIVKLMDRLDAIYIIQTNGLLAESLDPVYWREFNTILLSIDGVESVTDAYRGRGVYRRVLKTARWLRDIGFKGDIVARMTVTEQSDIYREVTHLIGLDIFDHIHWQLNVVWSPRWKNFRRWLEENYKPGLNALVKLWIEKLSEGRIPGLAPFQGILKRLILNGSNPPCGAGVESFSILTDGTILACPIAVDVAWAKLGDIYNSKPENLPNKVTIGEPCTSCHIFQACGGRCLYTHIERLWGIDGFKGICEATEYLVGRIIEVKPFIEKLVVNGLVDKDKLLYPAFNNTVEVIP
ncbi:MAG: TIGR04084 family radical SAM/SPASM domain-containing protein [Candidatus Bathyarchaeia archaeon]